jgi:hypothetical protein
MTTGDKFLNATDKRQMGFEDFKSGILDYVIKKVRAVHQTAYGQDGIFGGVTIAMSGFGSSTGRFQLQDNYPITTDGLGNFLRLNAELAGRDVGIAFENDNGTEYHVGLHYAERPADVGLNAKTGIAEFATWQETIGERWEPNTIVDNGTTMTFRVNSVCGPTGVTGWTGPVVTHAGRKCLVWKKIPGSQALVDAQAVELLTVAFTGGHNVVTSTGLFGQVAGAVDVDPTHYYCLLLGPTVVESVDLEVQQGYVYLGTVTGAGGTTNPSTFDGSDQNELDPIFVAELSVTRLDTHGDLKIRVRADSADNNEKQLEAQAEDGTPVWYVNEDGDETVLGNQTLGATEGNTHPVKGSLVRRNTANAIVEEVHGPTGETGVGGARVAGVMEQVYGDQVTTKTVRAGSALTTELQRNTVPKFGGSTPNFAWPIVFFSELGPAAGDYIFQEEGGAGNDPVPSHGWIRSANARKDATNLARWERIQGGMPSGILQAGSQGLQWLTRQADQASPWTNVRGPNGWAEVLSVTPNGLTTILYNCTFDPLSGIYTRLWTGADAMMFQFGYDGLVIRRYAHPSNTTFNWSNWVIDTPVVGPQTFTKMLHFMNAILSWNNDPDAVRVSYSLTSPTGFGPNALLFMSGAKSQVKTAAIPLELPQGAIITGCILHGEFAPGTGTLRAAIVRNAKFPPTTGPTISLTAAPHYTLIPDSAAAMVDVPLTLDESAGNRTVNNTQYTYYLQIYGANTGVGTTNNEYMALVHARVLYTLTRFMP